MKKQTFRKNVGEFNCKQQTNSRYKHGFEIIYQINDLSRDNTFVITNIFNVNNSIFVQNQKCIRKL